ncbi:uncharacterized protein PG986_015161 [Apiospora aurea]|uniref:Uncharacterized protein n=1 Tax=Apiospora aurea TaxID=335848 RepID=A0ABR1PRS2_9PEZI
MDSLATPAVIPSESRVIFGVNSILLLQVQVQVQEDQVLILIGIVRAGDGHVLGGGTSQLARDDERGRGRGKGIGGVGSRLLLLGDGLQRLGGESVHVIQVFRLEADTTIRLLDEVAVDDSRGRREDRGSAGQLADLAEHLGFLDDSAEYGIVAELSASFVALVEGAAGDDDILLNLATRDDRIHLESRNSQLLIGPLDRCHLDAALDRLLVGGAVKGGGIVNGAARAGLGQVRDDQPLVLEHVDSLANLVHLDDEFGGVLLDIAVGDVDDLRELVKFATQLLQASGHGAVSGDHVVNERALEEVFDFGLGLREQLRASHGGRHVVGGLPMMEKKIWPPDLEVAS